MKVQLCENNKDGHHKIYLDNLIKIKITSLKYKEVKINSSIKEFNKYFFERKSLLNYFLEGNDIKHILYLDMFYILPVLKKLYNKKKKIIATLHFIPINKIKLILLKNFSKKINKIIVHSEFLKEELLKNGIVNVELVEYPSFYDYSKVMENKILKKNIGIDKSKIVITALGGTRLDKGLDILLESFKYISLEIKNRILLNIAGKEETYKKDFISLKAQEYNINILTNYNFLTDEEFMKNVKITDIMVMPYRKIFGGNSGPMTEAIVNEIPCITPRELNIGKLTEKYNLGLTFECENPRDLARAIEEMIEKPKKYFTTDYQKRLTVENFLKRHDEIYNELIGEME